MTRARDVANIDGILTTKGDIYAATAAATPARLGVGSNGDTIIADSSTSTGLRYNPQNVLANPVIGGGMDYWQRGISFNSGASPIYTADRWCFNRNGGDSGATVSRQNTSDSTNLPFIQYCARVQRDSGTTSTTGINFWQSLETVNSIPFAGKTVTFSFYARAGANYSSASNVLTASFYTGTGTDQNINVTGYTGVVNNSNNATLTTSWQRFAYQISIASNVTDIGFIFGYAPSGTAGANDWYELTGVQIDVGTYTASTAPAFRRSGGSIQGELGACQRYYQRFTSASLYLLGLGIAQNTTTFYGIIDLPTTMRVTPTVLDINLLRVTNTSAGFSPSGAWSIYTNGSGLEKVCLTNSTFTGLTTGSPYMYELNGATAYVGLGAEL